MQLGSSHPLRWAGCEVTSDFSRRQTEGMARDAVTGPSRTDPVSRILVSVTGLAVMVVALIWATSRSSPATWFIATLSGLIALGGIALLDLAGWGRVVIRAVALADIILGVITAFTVGVSL